MNNFNKKWLWIAGAIVGVVVIVTVVMLIVGGGGDASLSKMVFLGTSESPMSVKNGQVFTDYNTLKSEIPNNTLSRTDFEKNNYVFVTVDRNDCEGSGFEVMGYKVDGSKVTVSLKYYESCEICELRFANYLAAVSKDLKSVTVEYDNRIMGSENCSGTPAMGEKPMIYLYPEWETEVSVVLGHPEKLWTTYPKYGEAWKVLAKPSGELSDLETGRNYYGLYWEGEDYPARIHETGFVVKGEDTAEFLEEKLEVLGLSEREANEFIVYWLPRLEHNAYNYVYFATAEEINDYMPLEVEPRPDTVIRVMMEYKPLKGEIEVREQELKAASGREGFTVVEWGGSLIRE